MVQDQYALSTCTQATVWMQMSHCDFYLHIQSVTADDCTVWSEWLLTQAAFPALALYTGQESPDLTSPDLSERTSVFIPNMNPPFLVDHSKQAAWAASQITDKAAAPYHGVSFFLSASSPTCMNSLAPARLLVNCQESHGSGQERHGTNGLKCFSPLSLGCITFCLTCCIVGVLTCSVSMPLRHVWQS